MLSYELTEHSALPLYEQLYRLIRDDIHRGDLKQGQKLPSRRALAEHLGVSLVTVDSAYAQLIDEGYIRAEQRRGYFVAGAPDRPAVVSRIAAQHTAPVEPPKPKLLANFRSNETRTEMFPFTVWSKLIREQLSMRQDELLRNPPPQGREDLRTAIAEHLRTYRGLPCDASQVVIGAGSEYLYGLLVQLLGADTVFAVEDPGYRKAAQVYESHGAVCRHIPMDAKGLRADLLDPAGAGAVHVSPSHHYPTGRVMPADRRFELLRWVSEGNRFIIEDDHDSEFRMTGKPLPPLCSLDHSGHVIYLNTFTKTLASTIRISYMVLPPMLAARYRERLSFYSCTVSSIEQATLAAFISRGYFEKHLNRARNAFRRKRDLLLSSIRASLPARSAAIAEEDAGLHFLLTLRTQRTDDAVCTEALSLGIRLAPLSAFYHDGGGPQHCFIINYSSLSDEAIPAVCHALRVLHDRVCEA